MTEKPISLDEFRDYLVALRKRVEFLAACLEDMAQEIRLEENRLSDSWMTTVFVSKRGEDT